MVIPSDKFVVHFHSDQSNQDWGFRLEAKAPVSKEKAQEMADHEAKRPNKHQNKHQNTDTLGLYACQRALAESMNDRALAELYLDQHRQELAKPLQSY